MDDLKSLTPTVLHAGVIGTSPVNSQAIRARNGRFALISMGAFSISGGVTATFTLQDSADGSSFADVSAASPITYADTEAGATKAFAVDFNKVREYVRVQSVQNIAGNFLCAVVSVQSGRFRSADSSPATVEVL